MQPLHRLETGRLALVAGETSGGFVIRLRDAGTEIGGAALIEMDEPALWGVDVRLDEAWRGQGYATEAVGALTRVALELLGALRVELPCDAGQLAIARRLGFRPAGRVRGGSGDAWVEVWGLAELSALNAVVEPPDARDAAGAPLIPVDRADRLGEDWRDLRDYLDEYFEVSAADDQRMEVLAGTASVTLTLEKRGLRTWIIASATLPDGVELSPADALEANAARSMATFASAQGRYLLRRAMLFAATPPWVVRHCIRAFDTEIARNGAPRTAGAAPLSYYAD